ncbi:Adenosylhomocysteine nucleosidase [Bertholletia excelsa]
MSSGEVPINIMKKILRINKESSYLGIVVPNHFEMSPLLQSPSFVPDLKLPYLDISGRRFRMGRLETSLSSSSSLAFLNAGMTTQLLLSLFRVKGVLHFGIAGNAYPEFQIGDVIIPEYWADTGLWNWQRYGDGPEDELALESGGDYTREYGYLKFSNYDNGATPSDNLLNSVWYQPEEVFPVRGTPEIRQHAFWVPVDEHYFSLAKSIERLKMESCVNSTCLPRTALVARVKREFLSSKFNVTAIDMESAAVAVVCLQQEKPFIAIRSLSDLAGGGSSASNEAATFFSLAAQNAVDVVVQFIHLLSQ